MAKNTEEIREKLLELKAELETVRSLSQESRATVQLDQQSVGRLSRMDALQGQAMAQAAERQRRTDIQKIEAALRRLETDDYGFCVKCGDEISEKRLMADPSTAFCINCAR